MFNPTEHPVSKLTRKGNNFRIGSWEITAELDAAKPADILIRNTDNKAVFSLSNHNILIKGTNYQREKGSSLLYDEIDGEWTICEVSDRQPQPTGAVPEMK